MFATNTNLTQALNSAVEWTAATLGSRKFWIGAPVGVLAILLIGAVLKRRRYSVSKVSIKLPFNLGNVEYEPTDLDRALAWKLYVQLKTRKAALMFDDDNDVIAEVYDSLYDIFPITRDLLAQVPLREASKRDGVAELILRVLNDGLRPHLTKWGAAYRRWWDVAKAHTENKNKTPQEIQKDYPNYKALVKELKAMNTELSKYAEDLLAIVQVPAHKPQYRKKKIEITPEQPQPPTSPAGVTEQPAPDSAKERKHK